MERSLIGMSACSVWRRISHGCAQELGESTEKSSSPLSQTELLSPLHSLMWLNLLSPSCLCLFSSTDTKTIPGGTCLSCPSTMTGKNSSPRGFVGCLTISCHPSQLQLWHLCQPSSARQSSRNPTVPRLRQPCTMATTTTPMATATTTTTTTDYSNPAEAEVHPLLLPQASALADGLFPNLKECLSVKHEILLVRQKRGDVVSDNMVCKGKIPLYFPPLLSHSCTHMQADIKVNMGSISHFWKKGNVVSTVVFFVKDDRCPWVFMEGNLDLYWMYIWGYIKGTLVVPLWET